VPIHIDCLSRIILDPWIPESVFDSVKTVIKGIDGCNEIRIVQTTLIDNELWKKRGEEFISPRSDIDLV
jgi:hypothetical protein